jgi:hypothetical protein
MDLHKMQNLRQNYEHQLQALKFITIKKEINSDKNLKDFDFCKMKIKKIKKKKSNTLNDETKAKLKWNDNEQNKND